MVLRIKWNRNNWEKCTTTMILKPLVDPNIKIGNTIVNFLHRKVLRGSTIKSAHPSQANISTTCGLSTKCFLCKFKIQASCVFFYITNLKTLSSALLR